MQNYHPRLNNYHSHKQHILGNQGARPAPAWKPNARAAASGSGSEVGSKILLSRLPADVVEDEVEILFSKTVGPVKEVIMVYNSQGKSRGTAIVSFTRPGDAVVARAKYNGKIVDGRRPIKIEIITDEDDARKTAPAPAPAGPPSLLDRIAPANPRQAVAAAGAPVVNGQKKVATTPVSGKVHLRTKKGPRRLNKQRGQQQAVQQQQQQRQQQPAKQKQNPKTREELDAEMDDYHRVKVQG
ncbi:hypothetical protein L227DRAFT_579211 [Lentinus tigrinus ALCF2SS1-6]|uniref:RRM domain-containing protein n=1 Tax=Lentinus tigrinus ALCF2SS1-6 TaxID=1328759 RepID=A0A5C2RY47_9APHY|nr:hypothetical protein L227DRAFT_579211 [Lentinus tigrinus ALCF2SS1-6]